MRIYEDVGIDRVQYSYTHDEKSVNRVVEELRKLGVVAFRDKRIDRDITAKINGMWVGIEVKTGVPYNLAYLFKWHQRDSILVVVRGDDVYVVIGRDESDYLRGIRTLMENWENNKNYLSKHIPQDVIELAKRERPFRSEDRDELIKTRLVKLEEWVRW